MITILTFQHNPTQGLLFDSGSWANPNIRHHALRGALRGGVHWGYYPTAHAFCLAVALAIALALAVCLYHFPCCFV